MATDNAPNNVQNLWFTKLFSFYIYRLTGNTQGNPFRRYLKKLLDCIFEITVRIRKCTRWFKYDRD